MRAHIAILNHFHIKVGTISVKPQRVISNSVVIHSKEIQTLHQ